MLDFYEAREVIRTKARAALREAMVRLAEEIAIDPEFDGVGIYGQVEVIIDVMKPETYMDRDLLSYLVVRAQKAVELNQDQEQSDA